MSLKPIHVVKQTNKICSATVIFLHGSGDSGQGLLGWVRFLLGDFSVPHIKFYFPTAPTRAYTPLQGELSRVWFDRYNVTPDVPEHKETLESTGLEINTLINKIEQDGIPRSRIVIGGFSMGGALALHTAFRFTPGLAGVFTLSSFLSNSSVLYNGLKAASTPLYMCHGDYDTMVPISWGQTTYQNLIKLGAKGEFIPIKNALHELKKNELQGLFEWIKNILPPLDTDE